MSNENLAKETVFNFEQTLSDKQPDSESWITLYQDILELLDNKDKE